MRQFLITFFVFSGVLFIAGSVHAATEFTSIIDPDNGPNTDYTSLSAWEQAVQADLTAATTRVFSYQSDTANGSMSDGITVEGQQSGATATLNHMTASTASAQILLTGISGTFQNGEQVYVQSTGASSTYIFLADSGDSAIAVATCRSTGGSADTGNVYIDGWTTSTSTYMKIWADPDDEYGRHNGKWSEHKYRLKVNKNGGSVEVIRSNEVNNIRIEGLQIMVDGSLSVGTNRSAIGIRLDVGSGEIFLSNNIIRGYKTYVADYGRGIMYAPNVFQSGTETLYVYNNLIYDFYSTSTTDFIGIRKEHRDADNYYYNNTIVGCNIGFSRAGDNDDMVIRNSIIQGSDVGFSNINSNGDYNISNDGSVIGSNSKANTTVRFENRAGDDFHLSVDDTAAIDAGTTSVEFVIADAAYDIDGTHRGAAFDIGADEKPREFVSTICENRAAGGDCANLDYRSLYDWDEAVRHDLNHADEIVYTGFMSGAFTKGDNLDVYDCSGTCTDTGTDVDLVATTSDQIFVDVLGTDNEFLPVASGTQFRLSGGTTNMWTVNGTSDDLGATPVAVAKIDGTWNDPDNQNIKIDRGYWTNDFDNYIRIYTTELARHNGKWNVAAYRLDSTVDEYPIDMEVGNIQIEGLQIRTNQDVSGIHFNNAGTMYGESYILDNLVISIHDSHAWDGGIRLNSDVNGVFYVSNNIVIGYNGTSNTAAINTSGDSALSYIYNNTVTDSDIGFLNEGSGHSVILKNNVSVDCNDAFNDGGGLDSVNSTHNAFDEGSDPGVNGIDLSGYASTTIFKGPNNGNFHLANDSPLKDAGADLSNDQYYIVSNDIDGSPRDVDDQGFDIGADELGAKIYRSVGNTSSDLSNGGTVTINSSTQTATFTDGQADNIGVGDVIQYGGAGYYKLAFITSRASSTEYTVQSYTGGIPTATTSASFSIYRAHRELNDWETQTVNPSIDSSVQSQVEVSQDLVASGTIMMVPCYAADTVDDAAVEINGWTTGEQNYIQIYTPYKSNEVGESQRHNGKWDESAFYLEYTTNSDNVSIIQLNNDFVRIIGLQIKVIANNDWSSGINTHNLNKGGIWLLSNIVWGSSGFDQYNNGRGIRIRGVSEGYESYIAKNIVYGFEGSNLCISGFESDNDNTVYVYNNTVVDCGIGYSTSWKDSIFINNVCMDSDTCFDGYTDPDMNTSNNISSDATAPGIDSITNATVQFVDEANDDFHLSPNDTVAIDAGTSSVTSYGLQVTSDIDGDYRRSWDIGADEASVEFVSTVEESGGDFSSLASWEQANQVDLTATTTAVFECSEVNGSMPVGSAVTGTSSGATANVTVMSTSSSQILLYNIDPSAGSGRQFSIGEKVYIDGDSTASNYCILSNAGNPAIAVAKIDGAWSNPDTTAVDISGWTTAERNYIRIYTTDAARHNGKWSDSSYRMQAEKRHALLDVGTGEIYYTKIEGLQIYNTRTVSASGIYATPFGAVSNCIIKGNTSASSGSGLVGSYISNGDVYFYNNIIYDFPYHGITTPGADGGPYYIQNNSIYNCATGIAAGEHHEGNILINNIVQDCDIDYTYASDSSTMGGVLDSSGNNVSSDGTAPGANSITNADVGFVNEAGDDFHLSPNDSVAIDAGTTSVATDVAGLRYDIDNTARGAAFDIGADEVPVAFESIICENTGAGGDCPDLDYNNLGTWEEALESDITASTTRVFSGSINGVLYENNTVWLYDSGLTSTKAVGTVLGTTSDQILIDNIISSSSRPLIAQDGDIWRRDGSNYWTVTPAAGPGQPADDGLGASPRVEAKIDGTWLNPDTHIFRIIDWVVDQDNTIKIYTTDLARHNGKWDESAYRLYNTEYDVLFYHTVLIDGIQVDNITRFNSDALGSVIANSIFKSSTSTDYIVRIDGADDNPDYIYMYNNIVYGDGIVPDRCVYTAGMGQDTKFRFYNNAVFNCLEGLDAKYEEDNIEAVNNVIFNCGDDFVRAEYFALCDHNASDDGDGTNAISLGSSAATWESAFVDYTNYDFHLKEDSILKDQGLDISASSTLALAGFDHDIDGSLRDLDGQGWDIGADELASKIYRSVGNTSSDLSNGGTVTINSSTQTATFTDGQADNIGVGDVIQYGGAGYYKLAFITSRASSTEYTVQSYTGGIPTATTSASFSVYRAHLELRDWETQSVNSSINSSVQSQVQVSQDLVASGTIMMVPCYAANTVDDAAVEIRDWATGNQNYIQVYTPYKESEVGASQRHNGKWDEDKYYLSYIASGNIQENIQIRDAYIRIEGLQMALDAAGNNFVRGIDADYISEEGELTVSNNIFHDIGGDCNAAIDMADSNVALIAYNNIIYGGYGIGINAFGAVHYIFNNTIVGCDNYGIGASTRVEYAVNNIIVDTSSGNDWHLVNGSPYSANNISDSELPPGDNAILGEPQFIDKSNNDFHLSPNDTVAIDAGTSSVTSYGLQVTSDIDGDYRRSWDIGADEASVEFVSTIEESGGDFSSLASWEQANQVDLTATTTAVFECSEVNGSMPVGSAVTGTSSGATANVTVMSISSSQILLYNISPSAGSGRQFSIGEKVYIDGDSTASNYCILSNAGNPAIAVAKIDGAWSNPDTTAVDISGWTTAERNYIRIYTTDAARHNGKWDESAYNLKVDAYNRALKIQADYTRINGIQLDDISSYEYVHVLNIDSAIECQISNNIIRKSGSGNDGSGIKATTDGVEGAYIWNNIIYGFNNSGGDGYESCINIHWTANNSTHIYNNTIYDCYYGIRQNSSDVVAINNIVQKCAYDFNNETFGIGSGYNISSDSTAPGSNSIINATVNFVDEGNNDFRLMPEDNPAVDAGTSLASDVPGVRTDIAGNSRPAGLGYDIGAFEAPAIWYRSVGRDTRDLSNGGTVHISSTTKTATFSLAQPDNIGVGDIIQYGNTGYYKAAVIAKRSSSTSYRVLSGGGSEPVATSSASFSIYRAHLTLDNWEEQTAGNVNSSIDSNLLDQVLLPSMNLTASNSAAFAACYASTSPDNEEVEVNGWTTGTSTYIKMYTPTTAAEVGQSQRHNGLTGGNNYRINPPTGGSGIILRIDHTRIEGIEILDFGGSGYSASGIKLNGLYMQVVSCLIHDEAENNNGDVINAEGEDDGGYTVYNNIIYNGDRNGIYFNTWSGPINYAYNNTIINMASAGLTDLDSSGIAKNNLVLSCGTDYSGWDTDNSGYNISSDGTHVGANSFQAVQPQENIFVDPDNYDYSLRSINSAAYDMGTAITIVEDDIIGTVRPTDANYDIGAFEYSGIKPKFRFTPGADATFRGHFEFR